MRIEPYKLSAAEALDAMAAGRLTSVQLVQSCLDRIAETDGSIRAWAHLDADAALVQASEALSLIHI